MDQKRLPEWYRVALEGAVRRPPTLAPGRAQIGDPHPRRTATRSKALQQPTPAQRLRAQTTVRAAKIVRNSSAIILGLDCAPLEETT
jgi:hypothetical protein